MRAAIGAVVTLAVLGACGGGRDTTWDPTYRGVCATAEAAADDRLEAARRTFTNDAHAGLHRLAAELQDRSTTRVQAGELLRAKQAVERDLTGASVAVLLDATRRAVKAETGDDPGTCPI